MKKIVSGLLIVLFFAQARAQLLWEITHNGTKAGYLFGTIHIGHPIAYQFSDSVMICLKSCQIMAGEIKLLDVNPMELLGMVYMPGDTTLALLLDSGRYAMVRTAIAQKLGFLAAFAERIKPLYLSMLFNDAENQTTTQNPPLDLYLQTESSKAGLEVIGLETLAEQLAALDQVSLRRQAEMLFEQVAEMQTQSTTTFDSLLALYSKGDIESLYRLSLEKLDSQTAFGFLTRRNIRMANRLANHITRQKVIFAAVGAGHLGGPTGMINLLRRKGFILRPVDWKRN